MTDKQFNFFKYVFKIIFENLGEISLDSFRYEEEVFGQVMTLLSELHIEDEQIEFVLASYVETIGNLNINDINQIDQLNKEDIVIPTKREFSGWVEFRATSIVTEYYKKNCYLPSGLGYYIDNYSIEPVKVDQEFIDTWDHEKNINI